MPISMTGFNDLGADRGADGKYLDTVRWTMTKGDDTTFQAFQRVWDEKANDYIKTSNPLTKFPMKIQFDFANVESAWIKVGNGYYDCHSIRLVDLQAGMAPPPQPSPDHSQGFRIKVYNSKLFEGVRYFAGTSKILRQRLDDLHSKYVMNMAEHEGEAPIVTITGKEEIKSNHGTYYAPEWDITGWAKADVFPDAAPAVQQPAPTAPVDVVVAGGSPPPADNQFGAEDFG